MADGEQIPHALEVDELLTVIARIVARLLSAEIKESRLDGLKAA